MRLFRQILLTIALALVVTFGPASTCLASEQALIVRGSYVNLRSGPGMKYPVKLKAPSGAFLKMIGRQGNWYKVTTSPRLGSKTLWVSRNTALELLESNAVTQLNANLRSGPSFQFPVAAKIPKGTPLKVVDKNGLWYKVVMLDENLRAHSFWVTARTGVVKLDNEPAQATPAPASSQAAASAPATAPPQPAPAAAPAPQPQPSQAAAAAGQRWLVRNTLGRFVILDDSSYYKIAPGDQNNVLGWSPGDNINVMKNNEAAYPFILFNTSRGNGAKALAISQ